jgi:hypothetical protein
MLSRVWSFYFDLPVYYLIIILCFILQRSRDIVRLPGWVVGCQSVTFEEHEFNTGVESRVSAVIVDHWILMSPSLPLLSLCRKEATVVFGIA